jgi:hypothetical protein
MEKLAPKLAILGPLWVPKIQRKKLNDALRDEKGLSKGPSEI